MHIQKGHIVLAVLTVALIIILACLRAGSHQNDKKNTPNPTEVREHYGPPPGRARALSHNELGDRGWAQWPPEYTASSASSISHMMLRSA